MGQGSWMNAIRASDLEALQVIHGERLPLGREAFPQQEAGRTDGRLRRCEKVRLVDSGDACSPPQT